MMETIKQAKEFLRANFSKGCKCPACGQRVMLYKRKINSGMALFLIGLYRLDKRQQDSVPGMISREFFSNKQIMKEMNINTSSLDYSVLRHFGLIEPRVSEDGKKDSGYWKITHLGFMFVKHGKEHPKYVFLFNNKRQGFSEEKTTINQALGDKFDFQELMKGY